MQFQTRSKKGIRTEKEFVHETKLNKNKQIKKSKLNKSRGQLL